MNQETKNITNEGIWEKIAIASKKIQVQALAIESRSELLTVLAECDLPFDKAEFSVIYKAYGAQKIMFNIAYGEFYKNGIAEEQAPFSIDLPCILKCIKEVGKNPEYYKNAKECEQNGFMGYKSIVLAPMRLNDKRNSGILILHSKENENAYDNLVNPLDVLGDRVAFYMKANLIQRRNSRFNDLHAKLLRKEFSSEENIIEATITELKRWFSSDQIYILLVNPFNLDEYLLACDGKNVIPNFRKLPVISEKNLQKILGNKIILDEVSKYKKGLKLDSISEIEKYGITSGCKSWLGVRMQVTVDSNIGYIILQNPISEESYEEDEGESVASVVDILGVMLFEARRAQKEKTLTNFKEHLIQEDLPLPNNENLADYKLYKEIDNILDAMYGKLNFAIAKRAVKSQKLEIVHSSIEKFELNNFSCKDKDKDKDKSGYDILLNHILKTSALKDSKIKAEDLTLEHKYLGTSLVTPMRVGKGAIGCFIVPAPKCGSITARYIDNLSDLLAMIFDQQLEAVRQNLLKKFGYEISVLKPDELSQEKTIELASKKISEAMYSENLYIALYDKTENKISFPYIKKDGQDWSQEDRFLNPDKKGKTEEIILTKKPLLHFTREESEKWYKETGNKEFAGDYLASWLGVPIFTPEGVRGVIATYHPTENYVYSEGDKKFLEMLSYHVSGLFRALELEKANRELEKALNDNTELEKANRELEKALNDNTELEKANRELEKAQQAIAERESYIASTLVAQDITHRLYNSLGGLSIQLDQAANTISNFISYNEVNEQALNLLDTASDLKDAKEITDELLMQVNQVTSPKPQKISLRELITKLAEQVLTKNGFSKNIFYGSFPQEDIQVRVFYRNLSTCLYELIENAVISLKNQSQQPIQNHSIYLKIKLLEQKDFITIEVIDNGIAIPEKIKQKIFERGITSQIEGDHGYGLWRAKMLAETLEGKLDFTEEKDIKSFRLSLPISYKEAYKPLALIVEDQKVWRDIIKRWLTEINFECKTVSDIASFNYLIKNLKKEDKPELFILDIALDAKDFNNVDGLGLISEVKALYENAKIVILTGFKGNVVEYTDRVDLIIEKVREGKVLTKETFIKEMAKIKLII